MPLRRKKKNTVPEAPRFPTFTPQELEAAAPTPQQFQQPPVQPANVTANAIMQDANYIANQAISTGDFELYLVQFELFLTRILKENTPKS